MCVFASCFASDRSMNVLYKGNRISKSAEDPLVIQSGLAHRPKVSLPNDEHSDYEHLMTIAGNSGNGSL